MKKGYKITNNGSGIIPEGTTVIAKEAFSQCTKLTWVIIPDSVTEIEDLAFSDCTNLTDIILPNSLKKIGWCAFAGCTGLTKIEIPNSVETIDDRAFADCTRLTSITLPDRIEELSGWLFFRCTSLTDIVIPHSVKVINNSFSECTALTRIVIPDSVNLIDDTAFEGCTSLTIADFEGAVEEIGEGIFYECDRLAMILVPEGTAEHYKKRLDEEVHHLIVEKTPAVVGPNTDHVLTITDTMTVGEFCHFFDYLFDGKAEVRIHNYYHGMLCESRMKDDYPMRNILKRSHASELTLDSRMTVYEAEKLLTACVNSGYFVNIYPQKRCYRITKEMSLKDIRQLQAELSDTIETNKNYPEKAEDINMIAQSLDIENVPNTRWTLYISFESKGKYYVWKRWVDRVDYQVVDGKDNISLEEFKYGKLFELCIECDVEKIFNHIENDLGFALNDKRKERIKNLIIKGRHEDWYILPERDSISYSMSTAESIVEYLTSGKTEEEWDAIYKKREDDAEADEEDSTAAEWYNDATAEVASNTDTEEKKLFAEVWGFGTYRDEWCGELYKVYNKKS